MGRFIGVKEKTNVFELWKTINVQKFEKTKLKATALGVYFIKINGHRAGNEYMSPWWTSYNKMLQVQTYDVSEFLKKGKIQYE